MEKLIEELTKVNPSNLSEEGLKLFNKINEIIDRNEELEKNYINPAKARISYYDTKKGTEVVIQGFIPISLIKEKIEELKDKANRIAGTYQYADSDEALENKKEKVIELRIKAEGLEELLGEEK